MFGLDRSAGHSLYYSSAKKTDDVFQNLQYIPFYKFKNQASADFWTILDNNNASTNWKWNYYGGTNENKLKKLASKILFPQFKNKIKIRHEFCRRHHQNQTHARSIVQG